VTPHPPEQASRHLNAAPTEPNGSADVLANEKGDDAGTGYSPVRDAGGPAREQAARRAMQAARCPMQPTNADAAG
jgi:hypothetical protein